MVSERVGFYTLLALFLAGGYLFGLTMGAQDSAPVEFTSAVSAQQAEFSAGPPQPQLLTFGPPIEGQPDQSGDCACCSGGEAGGTAESDKVAQAVEAAKGYYINKYGDTDFEAVGIDAGCHVEVRIFKEGKLVTRIGVYGNRILEY